MHVIDACLFPSWPGTEALTDYMDETWRELLLRPGDRLGPVPVLSPRLYADPRRSETRVTFDSLRSELIESGLRERIVLGWDDGLFSTVLPYEHVVRNVVRAANDWLVDEFLRRSDVLYGMMLISSAAPSAAADEIRRVGEHPRIAAVALGCNGLGRPFGDSIYLPIFEAAAELGLPVVLQVGSDASTDQLAPPVAGGQPSTFAEYRALAVHSHMSHVASMIVNGLFERLPTLQVLLVGGGLAWVPSWLWRLNFWMKRGRRTQAPWLNRLPSDYFADHVRLTTDADDLRREQRQLDKLFTITPELERTLLYASQHPAVALDDPNEVVARLPRDWQAPVLRGNAREFFRWAPDDALRATNPTQGG